jgi:hypothetical protein
MSDFDRIREEGERISREEGYKVLLAEIAARDKEIDGLRLAQDEREAVNAMACYFDTKGSITMQAWGSLLRVILLRNDAIGSV